jgi:tetratricopeptide (TPR) repeat protein
MKLALASLVAIALAFQPASAQQKLRMVNTETPEGQLLQQIGQENDEAKKKALLEEFIAKHGSHEGVLYAYSQAQPLWIKAGEFDKAIDAADKILAKDPKDVYSAYQGLLGAEGKRDADLVIAWSDKTSQAAKAVIATPAPQDEDEAKEWKTKVAYAKDVDVRSEYSLYGAGAQIPDPNKRILLADALRKRNPQSQYLINMGELEFNAYRQLNNNAKALETAERVLAVEQKNEDMLIFTADQYMQSKKQPDKVIEYGLKTVEIMGSKPKPEGISDADWGKKKMALTGLGNFIAGASYYDQKKYNQSDEKLKAALPATEGNDQLKAATLFYLGLTNHAMKNTKMALAYNQQCAKIKSQFQAKAVQNMKLIQAGK